MNMRTIVSNPAHQLFWFPCIWIEMIWHKNQGEFYLWKTNRKALLWGFIVPVGVWANPPLTDFSPYAHYFFIIYVARTLFELARLSINKLRNRAPHSHSMGQPMRLWRLVFPNSEMISRYVEPSITVLAGAVLILTEEDQLLGYLLIWCGLALWHKFNVHDTKRKVLVKETEDRKGENVD